MDNQITHDTRTYADIQDLQKLHAEYGKNAAGVKKEVSQQFEAMLMQLVLQSMRDANKPFESGMFGDNQMDFYQDMFDKQLTVSLSSHDIGFAKLVEQNIDNMSGKAPSIPAAPEANMMPASMIIPAMPTTNSAPVKNPVDPQIAPVSQPLQAGQSPQNETFKTEEDFVKKLWPSAKTAANALGVTPGILLAQAALETEWGKKILPNGQDSSHNLFNIKADSATKDKAVTVDTLEQKNGVLVKEKASFRTYDSYTDSFKDYVNFLKQNTRYKDALDNAANPTQYIKSLHSAGYATDSHYSDKILKIFSSSNFQNILEKMR